MLDLTVADRQLSFTRNVLDGLEKFERNEVLETIRVQCGLLSDWRMIEQKATHNIIIGVYTWDLLWKRLGNDEIYTLYEQNPWCDIGEFSYKPEQFMEKVFELDWATVRNYCGVAETWFINPPDVQITVEGEVRELNPEEIGHSKLLLFTAKERKGEMTPEDYDVLGSGCSWRKMRQHLLVSKHGDRPMNDKVILLDGGILWAKDGTGERVAIGSLEVDDEDDLVRWGVERIVKAAGVKVRG